MRRIIIFSLCVACILITIAVFLLLLWYTGLKAPLTSLLSVCRYWQRTDDLMNTAAALKTQMPELQEHEAVVFMGHGTHHAANAMYGALERMFEEMEMGNVLIGTVEGFPELDNVIKKLKKSKISKVTLMPLMFVAGDHAQNDMASDEEDSWKTILTNEGFTVRSYLHGMGENAAIQSIYLQHIKDAIDRRKPPSPWVAAGIVVDITNVQKLSGALNAPDNRFASPGGHCVVAQGWAAIRY